MSKNRLDYIDVAKGIGMFFVILCHVNYTPSVLTAVYGFHMPLFFILSGFLFNKEKYKTFRSFLKKRVQTLIVPYIILYIMSLLFSFLFNAFVEGFTIEIIKKHGWYFINMFISAGGSSWMVAPPLWFVMSLFGVEILYYFISRLKTVYIIAVCISISAIGWFIQAEFIAFPNLYIIWNLDSSMFVLSFYALGNLFKDKIIDFIDKIKEYKFKYQTFILLFVVCLLIYIPIAFYNGKVTIGSKHLSNGLLLYVSGIVGTISVLAISCVLEKIKCLKFCGKNSFYLMAFHTLIIWVVREVLKYDVTNINESIVPLIIVCLVTLLVTWLYKKVSDKIENKLFKTIVSAYHFAKHNN